MTTFNLMIPAILTLATGLAVADDHKKFEEADRNGDGILSMEEASNAIPGLESLLGPEDRVGAGGSAGAVSSQLNAADPLTREQISRVLPSLELDEERGPVDEQDYEKIVEAMSELGNEQRSSTGRIQSTPRGQSSSGSTSTPL